MIEDVIRRSCELWLNGRGFGGWRVGGLKLTGRTLHRVEGSFRDGNDAIWRRCMAGASETQAAMGGMRMKDGVVD